MSFIMHEKRRNCINFIKRHLKENRKVSKAELRRQIMLRFDFSGTTADRYISDIITMRLVTVNDDHLVYVEPENSTPEET